MEMALKYVHLKASFERSSFRGRTIAVKILFFLLFFLPLCCAVCFLLVCSLFKCNGEQTTLVCNVQTNMCVRHPSSGNHGSYYDLVNSYDPFPV